MAFQLKNFISIAGAMINHMRGTQTAVTDFNIGAVARTMVEAVAVEIDELYQQMFNGLLEAIPVATYNSFNFSALPATAASQLVQVTISTQTTNVLVAAGTVFSSPLASTTYISQADITIDAGATTANVLVYASTAGVIGNLVEGVSFTASPSPVGFVSASNAAAFSNGTDAETPEQRQQRFQLFIASLPRGTTDALVYGAKTTALFNASGLQTEAVRAAAVIEPYVADNTQPIGLVNLYVHNGVGSTSSDLVTFCQSVINGYTDSAGVKHVGWKAAGVSVVVSAATEIDIPVAGLITPAVGYTGSTLIPLVTAAINAYILSLDLGQSFVFSELTSLIMAIPGIANFVFSTPTTDQAATSAQKLMPGALTITSTS